MLGASPGRYNGLRQIDESNPALILYDLGRPRLG